MDQWKSVINQMYEEHPSVLASIAVPNPDRYSPLVDGFDYLVLVITEATGEADVINDHYSTSSNLRIQIRQMSQKNFEAWIMTGSDRRIIQWIMDGRF